jgi:uncharacterized RDD family membrane protein YckC
MLFLVSYAFQQEYGLATQVRVAVILFMFFVYEPLCTSLFCTVGQKITGIRVRSHASFGDEKISLPKAYLRVISKVLLGFVSFFTIMFSKEKRALHDFIAGSIVLEKK